MISPESYYNEYLKDKGKKELLSVIRGLKNKMGRLKNVMEHPDYKYAPVIYPGEDVRISCNREYLVRAILALEELGGIYKPSKADLKAADFQDNLEYVSKITFEIGGYFDGVTTYIIEFQDDKAGFKLFKFDSILEEKPMDKDEIMWQLSRLYIGEWRTYYNPKRFGYCVIYGTQWNVSFEYFNGHKTVEFAGSNDYPYNFSEFIEIFGLENGMETDMEKDGLEVF